MKLSAYDSTSPSTLNWIDRRILLVIAMILFIVVPLNCHCSMIGIHVNFILPSFKKKLSRVHYTTFLLFCSFSWTCLSRFGSIMKRSLEFSNLFNFFFLYNSKISERPTQQTWSLLQETKLPISHSSGFATHLNFVLCKFQYYFLSFFRSTPSWRADYRSL